MMKHLVKFAAMVLATLAFAGTAYATSCPAFYTGEVLTAAQWQACFDAKENVLGFTPVNKAGDTMSGKLTLSAGTTTIAPFNIPEGSAPTTPSDGDLWTTSAGLFVRIAGVTYQATFATPFAVADGGTGADLSATGGANEFVKQSSAGAAFTVGTIGSSDITSALTTPPAIGGTTPGAGDFTTLGATGHTTFEGVTSTGATGIGKIVYDNSPALSGTPTAPTPASASDNSTKIATTAWINNALMTVLNYTCTLVPSSCSSFFGYHNIVWYGADNTGVADSLAAANAASAAINAAGGGVFYVPPGNYAFKISGTFSSRVQPIINVYSHMSVVCAAGATLESQAVFGGFNSALFTPTATATDFHFDSPCNFKAYPGIALTADYTTGSATVTLTSGTTSGFYEYMPVVGTGFDGVISGSQAEKYYVSSVLNSTQFTVALNGVDTPPTANGTGAAITVQYSGSPFIGSQPGNSNWSISQATFGDVNSAVPVGNASRVVAMGSNVSIHDVTCTYLDRDVATDTTPYNYANEDCIHALAPLSNFSFRNIKCLPSGDDCVALLVENDGQSGYDSAISGTVDGVSGISEWAQMLHVIVSPGMTAGTINVKAHDITGTANNFGNNPGSTGVYASDDSSGSRHAVTLSLSDSYLTCTNTALDCYLINNARDVDLRGLLASNPKQHALNVTNCISCALSFSSFYSSQTAGTDIIYFGTSDNPTIAYNVIEGATTTGGGIHVVNSPNGVISGNQLISNATALILDGASTTGNLVASNVLSGDTATITEVGGASGNMFPPGNIGYDPQAVVGCVVTTPSWTSTASPSWQTFYFNGGTVTNIQDTATSRSLFGATNVSVRVAPNQTITVTSSSAPSCAISYN